jgi:hypothetical protein
MTEQKLLETMYLTPGADSVPYVSISRPAVVYDPLVSYMTTTAVVLPIGDT